MNSNWYTACTVNSLIKTLSSDRIDDDTKDVLKETYNHLNKIFGEEDDKNI